MQERKTVLYYNNQEIPISYMLQPDLSLTELKLTISQAKENWN